MYNDEGLSEQELAAARVEMARVERQIDPRVRQLLREYCAAHNWKVAIESGTYPGLRGAYWRVTDDARSIWITVHWSVAGPYLDLTFNGRRARIDREALGQALHQATGMHVLSEWDEPDSYQDEQGQTRRMMSYRRLMWPPEEEWPDGG